MAQATPTVSHSFTIRVRIVNKPGMLAKALHAIAELKGDPGAIDVVTSSREFKVRDITVSAHDDEHAAVRKRIGIAVVKRREARDGCRHGLTKLRNGGDVAGPARQHHDAAGEVAVVVATW